MSSTDEPQQLPSVPTRLGARCHHRFLFLQMASPSSKALSVPITVPDPFPRTRTTRSIEGSNWHKFPIGSHMFPKIPTSPEHSTFGMEDGLLRRLTVGLSNSTKLKKSVDLREFCCKAQVSRSHGFQKTQFWVSGALLGFTRASEKAKSFWVLIFVVEEVV